MGTVRVVLLVWAILTLPVALFAGSVRSLSKPPPLPGSRSRHHPPCHTGADTKE